jgi:hypothetical protein
MCRTHQWALVPRRSKTHTVRGGRNRVRIILPCGGIALVLAISGLAFGQEGSPVGDALKQHLELLGANVSGPAATIAEAERLLAQSRLVHSLQEAAPTTGQAASEMLSRGASGWFHWL